MTPLLERIRDLIRMEGPIPVSVFMTLCLHDPEHGYYASNPGIGRDFQTAPEISQVFGELLGLWAAHEWIGMGSPETVFLIEPGPGRGVMMDDMLRAAKVAPGFIDALRPVLIEASPVLAGVQAQKLASYNPIGVRQLSAAPDGPFILIANEFLDCLPIRQFVRDETGWAERCIGLSTTGDLTFGRSPSPDPPDAPDGADQLERAPGMAGLVSDLSERFARGPGRALFIDYGPPASSPGDTLRAYRDGRQADPLSEPGRCDLTADVDFSHLARLAEAAGLRVDGPTSQGDFLLRLGLAERCARLSARAGARADPVQRAAMRLVDPLDMGSRFQAICLSPGSAGAPAGF